MAIAKKPEYVSIAEATKAEVLAGAYDQEPIPGNAAIALRFDVNTKTAGLRTLRDRGLLLSAHYQRERKQLTQRREAAFATEPTGPHQGWQPDFSEFETAAGDTWRIAVCQGYWSKFKLDAQVSPAPAATRMKAFTVVHPGPDGGAQEAGGAGSWR